VGELILATAITTAIVLQLMIVAVSQSPTVHFDECTKSAF